MPLHNRLDKETLKKKRAEETFERVTLSFYRYVLLNDVMQLRNTLYKEWSALGVLGRVYVANEGINAQISVPKPALASFKAKLYAHKAFADVPFKIAVEDDGKSFYKLIVKARKKLVADGLDDGSFDVTRVGKRLSAQEFHSLINDDDTVIIDMRNHYEYEVGHFEGAVNLDADTFRDALPKAADELQHQKNKNVLLYCTGGIRCEKASAYLKHHGVEKVYQLHGGIIEYANQLNKRGITPKFIGKNFVFDNRLGERITDTIISNCHQCGKPCDDHTNCKNNACHLLFIQCEACRKAYNGCCSAECSNFLALPEEEQRKHRKGKVAHGSHQAYKKGRLARHRRDVLNG